MENDSSYNILTIKNFIKYLLKNRKFIFFKFVYNLIFII